MSGAASSVLEAQTDLPADMAREIESSVAAAVEGSRKKDAAAEPAEEGDDDAEVSAEEPSGEPEETHEEGFKLSDALAERAVKAGIPLSEAREYASAKHLETVLGRIEALNRNQAGSRDGASEEGGKAKPPTVDELLSKVPDLDPAEYDEKIVGGFAALKDLVRQQAAVIEELRGSKSGDWIAAKMASVSEFTGGDAAKAESVRQKFNVLKAGYKSAGVDATDDAIFSEASKLVLGEAMEAARLDKVKKQADRRSKQLISRASGDRVQAKGDPRSETIAELERRFG